MSKILLIISLIACLAVLAVLLFGVGSFAKGGDFNRKHANKIMRLRLLAQAVAVALLVLTGLLASRGY